MGFVWSRLDPAGLDLCLQIGMRPAVHACFILIQSQGWPWHFLLMAEGGKGQPDCIFNSFPVFASVKSATTPLSKAGHVAKPGISGAGKYNPM